MDLSSFVRQIPPAQIPAQKLVPGTSSAVRQTAFRNASGNLRRTTPKPRSPDLALSCGSPPEVSFRTTAVDCPAAVQAWISIA
jgi:hypothetical protein